MYSGCCYCKGSCKETLSFKEGLGFRSLGFSGVRVLLLNLDFGSFGFGLVGFWVTLRPFISQSLRILGFL